MLSSLDLGRSLRLFSNVARGRFIRVTSSAEETAPTPGRRRTDRSTLVDAANLNMGNSSGARCHPLIRKILPITRFSPCKVSTKVAVVSLFTISLSLCLRNLTWSTVQGFVKGLKGLVSQGQQPQSPQQPQQQPGHMQQVSGSTSMMISPPITPMSSGGSNTSDPGVGGPMPPGSFDPMSPGTPTPTSPGLNQQYYSPSSPTSPGIQDPDASSQTTGQHMSPPPYQTPNTSKQNSTPGQKSKTMGMAMPNPQVNSTGGGGTQSGPDPNTDPHTYADPNQDPTATPNRYPNPSWFPGQDQNAGGPVPIQAQAQAQLSVQVTSPPTGAGGSHGNGNWNPNDPNLFPSRQLTPNSSGPSPTTCRLKGCNKSVFVDPTTYHQSDYCSHRHRQ